MPDVTRSDSQRSDASLKPRVSFNRDVHVKRIVPREGSRISGAVSGDGAGHLVVASPVRKEKLKRTKQELAEEAARVIHEADKLNCVTQDSGILPEKFYTLPSRKKERIDYGLSLDRKLRRRRSSLDSGVPPKKPPRTFAASPHQQKPPKRSILDLFIPSKKHKPKKSNLRRSVSDVTGVKTRPLQTTHKRSGSDNDEIGGVAKTPKKQLSPIIEVTQREDYFSEPGEEFSKTREDFSKSREDFSKSREDFSKSREDFSKSREEFAKSREDVSKSRDDFLTSREDFFKSRENFSKSKDTGEEIRAPARKKWRKAESVTEQLKQYIDEVDEELYRETGIRIGEPKDAVKETEVVIIDLDKAEKISKKKGGVWSKTLKSLTRRKNDAKAKVANVTPPPPPPRDRETKEKSEDMIHSSQKPAEKPPLTKGRTVDSMVKRLSHDSASPPPKTNILVTPTISVAHNNNQPFSYTRGLSPDSNEASPTNPGSPVIYAQVVCGNGAAGPQKQTVHTAYRKQQHSDSDEGLGFEGKLATDDYNDEEKFGGESPIMPKFRPLGAYVNDFSSYSNKFEKSVYVDSSSRGRGDGMDAKRRESLTEAMESAPKMINGRSDLSARRDLLESRINRRINDQALKASSPSNNVYVSETGTKYHRGGSSSPLGYKESKRGGERYTARDVRKNYDAEPRSFDSDYRSSPENQTRYYETSQGKPNERYHRREEKQKMFKDRVMYQSNPEITRKLLEERRYDESYHDSLGRVQDRSSAYKSERYLDQVDDRKDKFGDSGIENDFKRDSGERYRVTRPPRKKDYVNDSEDEGFASSLLIASERQHTEENARKSRRDYDSDRAYSREEEYRHVESVEYRTRKVKDEYVPRERSIDDGSHYDPRIDKDFEVERSTLKRIEKKPPKPEKKSGLEKVKQLFSRESKKKNKAPMVREDSLRARYTEYKGSREHLEPQTKKKEVSGLNSTVDYSNRRRLSTPSPSPTRDIRQNKKTESSHGSWFKSLDRLSRKKTKKAEKDGNFTSTEEEIVAKPPPTKNLRFFGDTDIESNDSVRHKYKARPNLTNSRTRSQSTRDLHNISEEIRPLDPTGRKSSHKSLLNIVESERESKPSKLSMKPPISPNRRVTRETPRAKEEWGRRRKNEISSVESSTEGDSSQQSQRSIVYLHAATVGDIPGPGYLRGGRRAASREELASNTSSRIQPQVKTLSRSFSVLAPWKPKNYRESMDIDYSQYPKPTKSGKYEKRNGSSRKETSSTLKKKAHETRRSNQNMSTLNHRSRSKESVASQTLKRSKEEGKGSSSTLYKKKEKLPRENSRYNNREPEGRRMAAKSISVESLGANGKYGRRSREDPRDISRSVSMPRDPDKSAGWFKMSKKSKKLSGSAQQL